MKRSYTLLLAIAFMLALSACKKSETQQRLTLGNWMRLQTNTYGVTAVVEDVHFNDNGDMIQRMYLKDMLENKILGFYTKRLAKYRENNGMLELTDIREYGDYTGPDGYRDEKDLSLKQGILTEASIPFSVTDNASILTLGYLCPPNALCAQSYLVFNKVR